MANQPDFVKLIPIERFENAANQLTASTIVALQRMDKVVTGKTAQSIRTEVNETEQGYELVQYGGEWVRYIIEGKPANTKMPVVKVGAKFELIQSIKDWKAVRGLQMPDFLLARSIAENERKPVDLASASLAVFDEQFKAKLTTSIVTFTASEMANFFKSENQNNL